MSDLWSTSMGVWCDDLADLMLPFDRIALSRPDLVFMGSGTPGFSFVVSDPCPDGFSQMLKSDLTFVMPRYPMGVHLRLDLCSFKTGAGNPRVVGANGAMWLMRQPNPRVSGLIRRGLTEQVAMSLFMFPWLPIPPWAEFRIFIRARQVIGISQYHSDGTFPEIAHHEAEIRAGMQTFVEVLLPRLRIADAAIDVLAEPVGQQFRIRLVELNPLAHRTDPCLFTWEAGGDFDGTFRFRKGSPQHAEVTEVPTRAALLPAAAPPEDDAWRI